MAKLVRGLLSILFSMITLPATGHAQSIKVTLLGTGAPPPVMNRFGPSTLVEVGGQRFIFDAGARGAAASRATEGSLAGRGRRVRDPSSLRSRRRLPGPLVNRVVAYRTRPGSSASCLGSEGDDQHDVPIWNKRSTSTSAFVSTDDRASPDGVLIMAEDIKEGFVLERGGGS